MTTTETTSTSTAKSKDRPFLASLDDTAGMLEELFEELARVQADKAALQQRETAIQTKIGALNGLRQAHGMLPVQQPAP